jgi:hypothetical protein
MCLRVIGLGGFWLAGDKESKPAANDDDHQERQRDASHGGLVKTEGEEAGAFLNVGDELFHGVPRWRWTARFVR